MRAVRADGKPCHGPRHRMGCGQRTSQDKCPGSRISKENHSRAPEVQPSQNLRTSQVQSLGSRTNHAALAPPKSPTLELRQSPHTETKGRVEPKLQARGKAALSRVARKTEAPRTEVRVRAVADGDQPASCSNTSAAINPTIVKTHPLPRQLERGNHPSALEIRLRLSI